MDLIARFLKLNQERRLTCYVFGDSILDEYYNVKITRISPELPSIPVMVSEGTDPIVACPGGAGNVVLQQKNFNVDSVLFTVIDSEAQSFYFNNGVINVRTINTPDGWFIPRKRRFFDKNTQVAARWDIEKPLPLSKNFLYRIKDLWNKRLADPDVIVLSDYDKGFFRDWPYFDIPKHIPVIVDPKCQPLTKWHNCTIIKPNYKEAKELSGEKSWQDQCRYFLKEARCAGVIITQEGEGVVGYDGCSGLFEYRPAKRVVATRTEGAGDCFTAIAALALGHGFSCKEAAEIAFNAGCQYVQQDILKPVVAPWQLHRQMKFISPQCLTQRDYRLVMTNGCFDGGLTRGHIECLKFAKAQGDKLIVALNDDASVQRLKGKPRPFMTLEDRMAILASLEYVDFVVPFAEDTPLKLIQTIMPDLIVKGGDYKPEDVVGYGIVEVRLCPLSSCKSTSDKAEMAEWLAWLKAH